MNNTCGDIGYDVAIGDDITNATCDDIYDNL
jgi:hypothetical protein